MSWRVYQNHILPSVNNDITPLRSGAALRQPSAVIDQTKHQGENETQTLNKTTGKQSKGETGREQERGENKSADCEAVTKVTKKLLCLAFESIAVVWLSSYHSVSVNAVAVLSAIRECSCVCCQVAVISVTQNQCNAVFFFSPRFYSLALLSRLSGLDLPPQSMSLFPGCFEEITDSLLQKTSVKWKGTDNKRSDGVKERKEWKGERLGQITREGGECWK